MCSFPLPEITRDARTSVSHLAYITDFPSALPVCSPWPIAYIERAFSPLLGSWHVSSNPSRAIFGIKSNLMLIFFTAAFFLRKLAVIKPKAERACEARILLFSAHVYKMESHPFKTCQFIMASSPNVSVRQNDGSYRENFSSPNYSNSAVECDEKLHFSTYQIWVFLKKKTMGFFENLIFFKIDTIGKFDVECVSNGNNS